MNPREFHNIIVIGTICELSDDGTTAKVEIGDYTTKLIPLPAFYGRNFKASVATHENAQVVLNCPSGNLENAVIISLIWPKDENPYTASINIDGIKFTDGTLVQYDSETKTLEIESKGTINIVSDSDININADGNLTIETNGALKLKASEIVIEGKVTQSGGDMTSDGISVQEHKHPETGSITKKPNP